MAARGGVALGPASLACLWGPAGASPAVVQRLASVVCHPTECLRLRPRRRVASERARRRGQAAASGRVTEHVGRQPAPTLQETERYSAAPAQPAASAGTHRPLLPQAHPVRASGQPRRGPAAYPLAGNRERTDAHQVVISPAGVVCGVPRAASPASRHPGCACTPRGVRRQGPHWWCEGLAGGGLVAGTGSTTTVPISLHPLAGGPAPRALCSAGGNRVWSPALGCVGRAAVWVWNANQRARPQPDLREGARSVLLSCRSPLDSAR